MSQANLPTTDLQAMTDPAARTLRALGGAIVEASKPRITRLVTITSGVGFALAAISQRWDALSLAVTASGCLAGTALSAAGANALNQWMERDRDALMPRTCARPLPQRRLSPALAFAAGLILALAGIACLWAFCGPVPAAVSLVTVLTYLLLYTPLKPVTPLATLVGAVPGALPPLIGWSAAAGGEDPRSLLSLMPASLFAIMFIWQIPHFLAIAWMYREDYAAGGYRVLPVLDTCGRRTGLSILGWSLALIPATLAPALAMEGPAAWIYATLAAAMGVGYVALGVRFLRTRQRPDARRAFIASVIHLPLLLMLLVVCAVTARLI